MKKLNYYLDKAKAISGSDYKTAKILGVSRQAISNYRVKGTMSIECAALLADYISADFKEVVAACEVGKHPEKRDFWAKWVAALTIMSVGLLAISPEKTYAYAAEKIDHAIYYAHKAKLSLSYAYRAMRRKISAFFGNNGFSLVALAYG